jgi:CRP/FNR family cyclic AMP-dependent transcriptional regulator
MGKQAKGSFDPKMFLAKVGSGKTILEFRKDQDIFAQGDVADTLFYIQEGRVKLTVLSEHGKEAVVAILEPGQFFGEGCLNGHPLRMATTTAMESCAVTSIRLIIYNGKMEVHNSLLSAVMHDKPEIKRDEATGKE